MRRTLSITVLLAAGILTGCSRRADAPKAAAAPPAPAATNRVDVPAAVRQNLGLTFVKVEKRAVANTLRSPGRFELLQEARREYHVMLPGRLEPAVTHLQRVQAGDVLYRLSSPRWREMQQQIAEAEAAIRTAEVSAATIGPLREAHRVHEESLNQTVTLWTDRIRQLDAVREAGGGKADELAQARATLAGARAELAEVVEKDAELEAREREIGVSLESARARRDILIASASTVTGFTAPDLTSMDETGRQPRWRALDIIEVRAAAPGVVESIGVTPGAWAEQAALVLTVVQPELVRLRARGLQSDLGRLREGLPARVAPPTGPALDGAPMTGPLMLGLAADPDERTIDLLLTPATVAPWAKPGVAAYLEVTLEGGTPDLAIPLSAVGRDGVTPVIFRRDPKDPDRVIRLDADLGIDDGQWIVVRSGVREGDEVVLHGVYQLVLATSGSAAKGGHFHSDGTFHEGEDH